eukprot:3196913-Prymnesium_polylepis.1
MQARAARTSVTLVATASTSLSLAPHRAYCAPAAHGAAVAAPLIAPPTAMATWAFRLSFVPRNTLASLA